MGTYGRQRESIRLLARDSQIYRSHQWVNGRDWEPANTLLQTLNIRVLFL